MSLLAAINADYFSTIGRGIGAIVLYAILGLALLMIGFFVLDLATPGKLNVMVRDGRPNAVAITAAGLLSMAFIIVVAINGSSGQLAEGLLATLIFGLFGISVQIVAMRLLEWVAGFKLGALLAAERYQPQTLAVCAAHIALGLIVAVAII